MNFVYSDHPELIWPRRNRRDYAVISQRLDVYDNEKFTGYFNSNPEIRIEQNVYMRDLMIDYIKEVKNI